jgi:hypothetical protein
MTDTKEKKETAEGKKKKLGEKSDVDLKRISGESYGKTLRRKLKMRYG